MPNIFDTPKVNDFILTNNTNQTFIIIDAYLKPAIEYISDTQQFGSKTLTDLKIDFCEFKKQYLSTNSELKKWFDNGWISASPIIGVSEIYCVDIDPISASPSFGQAKSTSDDPITGNLDTELKAGTGIAITPVTELNGDKRLEISATGGGGGFDYHAAIPFNNVSVFIYTHNAGKFPSTRAIDLAGVEYNNLKITHPSVNQVKIETGGNTISGYLILN